MALTVWSQTKYPRSALGALDLVLSAAAIEFNNIQGGQRQKYIKIEEAAQKKVW